VTRIDAAFHDEFQPLSCSLSLSLRHIPTHARYCSSLVVSGRVHPENRWGFFAPRLKSKVNEQACGCIERCEHSVPAKRTASKVNYYRTKKEKATMPQWGGVVVGG
jgi:hypothetical protein